MAKSFAPACDWARAQQIGHESQYKPGVSMRLHQDAIAGCEALGITMRPEVVQQSHGRDCTSEVMVFGRPQPSQAGDRLCRGFVQRPLSQADCGLCKISSVTDLFVEQFRRRLVVVQRRDHSAGKKGNAVALLPHGGQQRVEPRYSAGIATLESAGFVQPLCTEDIGPVKCAVKEEDRPNAGVREGATMTCHGLNPLGRVGGPADGQLGDGQSLAGVFPREFVMLEIVFNGHGRWS